MALEITTGLRLVLDVSSKYFSFLSVRNNLVSALITIARHVIMLIRGIIIYKIMCYIIQSRLGLLLFTECDIAFYREVETFNYNVNLT